MPSPQVPNVYPVELEKVDISPYAVGNTDVPYCTTYDSGVAGPHVMVSALVHGNELCGAIALDWLFRSEVRPVVGRLTFAFLNVAAYGAFDPDDPTTSRYLDEDMNRIWDPHVLGDQDRQSLEVRRAREIRPL
ncbi:MAG: succinylglutamate desuccinylase/aspartoacylase family protein, partial [Pseudomonadota bacterium]